MDIAQGAEKLPPFERWGFSEERYVQYLCDQQAIHYMLENIIAESLEEARATLPPGDPLVTFLLLKRRDERGGTGREGGREGVKDNEKVRTGIGVEGQLALPALFSNSVVLGSIPLLS